MRLVPVEGIAQRVPPMVGGEHLPGAFWYNGLGAVSSTLYPLSSNNLTMVGEWPSLLSRSSQTNQSGTSFKKAVV